MSNKVVATSSSEVFSSNWVEHFVHVKHYCSHCCALWLTFTVWY